MHLLIRAVSLAGQPLTQAISAYFDERGGTMGRSDTNTLSLPDPERRISRLQAEVSRTAAGWQLLNVGNANPIWHNNKAVPPGETVLLDEGDELQVGTYSLHVSYASTEAARTITQGRAAVDSRTVLVGSGTEARTDPSRMASSFSVQMTSAPRTAATSAAHAGVAAQPALATAHADADSGATQLVPDAGRVNVTQARAPSVPATQAPRPAAPPVPAPSPFADLLGTPAPVAASAPAGLSGGSPFDDLFSAPLAAPAAVAPVAPVASSSAADPFADLLGAGAGLGARSASPAPSAPVHLPDDFDPFADLSPPQPAGAASPFDGLGLGGAAAGPTSAGQLQGLDFMGGQGGGAQGGSTSSIDQLFGLSGASSSADPLAGFLARTAPAAPQEAAVGAPSSIDPLALLTPSPVVPANATTPQAATDAAQVPHTASREASFLTLADDVPEVQGLMPLPAVVDAPQVAAPTELAPERVTVHGLAAALSATPAPAPAPFVRDRLPDDASFDDLLSGLAPTQPAALSVQPVELPALTAHTPRTQLKGAPLLVASTHGDQVGEADPLLSLSGQIALAEPVAFQTLMPHQAPHAPDTDTEPGALDAPSHPGGARPAAGAPGGTTGADTLALWSAFCQGAGVNFTPPQGLNPDLMRVIGRLLRNAVDGSVKLVAARAATKQELRAEVTVIQAKGNNPLKFSPDTESALEQLLQPPLRGFMPGPDAVADAMDDLLGHTIGTMVGTRAALEGVLKRFEPEQLEAKLSGRSMMDSLLPMNRRAKLWELYLQHYESVRTEAQEDFHNLFGKAFLQAYEEQLDRLDAERRAQKSTRSA
jgi:FHA domain-containing protein